MAADLSETVSRMRSQNMSNDEIAQRLLYQGFSNSDVFDAINQADSGAYSSSNEMGYSQETPLHSSSSQSSDSSIDTNKIEEIAESIIEEKWSDLVDHVNRIIEWKSSMELRLNTVDEQIKNIKSDFETLNKAILGRINDSDSIMREVSTDMKALESVFKKILPGFVENVNELSRITQSLKRK